MAEIGRESLGADQFGGALFRDPPSVTVTGPSGPQNTSTVTVTWVYSSVLAKPQRSFRVQILGQEFENVLYDSGTIEGAGLSFDCPFVLSGGSMYVAKVIVSDGVDLGEDGSLFSADLENVANIPPNEHVGSVFEVALNGVGYRLADNVERPYRRSTAQIQAPRLATGETPFSEAVERYTFLGSGDWSLGAGQRSMNRASADARAFWDSENVDPFEPGRVTLLPATSSLVSSSAGAVGAVVASGHLFTATGSNVVKRLTAPGATPDTITFTGDTLVDLASDGKNWYALNTDDEIFRGSGTSVGSVWSNLATPANGAQIIEWCTDRLAVVYTNPSGQSVLSTLAPNGVEEVVDGRFKFTDATIAAVAGGDGYLWFAVNRSDRSVVYAWKLGSDQGASIAMDVPVGERVTALSFYLGNVLIRTATADHTATIYRAATGQGELTPERVAVLEGAGVAFGGFTGVDRFVLFGWKGMSTDGRSGVGAIDLSTGGWCRWLQASSAGADGAVKDLFVWSGKVGFLVDGSGPQFPGATLSASGFVTSSASDLGSSLTKVFDSVSIGLDPLPSGGGVDVLMSFDNGVSFGSVGEVTAPGVREGRWNVGRQGSSVATKIVLKATGVSSPAVTMSQVKLHPLSAVDAIVELPISCSDRDVGQNGVETPRGSSGLARARELESLVGTRVTFQDVDWPVTRRVNVWEVVSTDFTSVGVFERGHGHRREAQAVSVVTMRRAR